jgi:rhamnogalacturonan endolyase
MREIDIAAGRSIRRSTWQGAAAALAACALLLGLQACGDSHRDADASAPASDSNSGSGDTSPSTPTTTTPVRAMEKLGRGVVAVRTGTKKAYVSWRLLALDPTGITFNVYKSTDGGAPVLLNASPLSGGTQYVDTALSGSVANTYSVSPVIDGVEQASGGSFTLPGGLTSEPVVRIPISDPPGTGYTTKYVWVGDLDGDGEYDFVIDRIAPYVDDVYATGAGHQFLEAYKRDGTRLWQIDMGPLSTYLYNIHPSAATLSMGMYDGVTVYDLDGDGKAEVILKIADGVVFPDGTTFSDSNSHMQYLAVLDGMTGKIRAKSPFPTDFLDAGGELGTQLGIGYANGVTPSIYFWGRNRNSDYTQTFNDVFASFSWDGVSTTLTTDWKYLIPGANRGGTEASHQMRIIDVDGDGRDELATGNFMLNSDGTLRYVLPGVGHGDRFYIGKFENGSTDMQGYGIQQNNTSGLLEYYYDASTGVIQWTHGVTDGSLIDVGRGLVGDIDPNYPGYEVWSFSGLYNGATNTLTTSAGSPYPAQIIWWDGDVLSEGLNAYKIEKWNPDSPTATDSTPRLDTLTKYGAALTGTNPAFIGDILGDWRTEVITMNSDQNELLIFTSNIPTDQRFYTMAQNPAYRNHMTIKGYMQSPMLDYYFGSGMSTPPVPSIRYVGS